MRLPRKETETFYIDKKKQMLPYLVALFRSTQAESRLILCNTVLYPTRVQLSGRVIAFFDDLLKAHLQ